MYKCKFVTISYSGLLLAGTDEMALEGLKGRKCNYEMITRSHILQCDMFERYMVDVQDQCSRFSFTCLLFRLVNIGRNAG